MAQVDWTELAGSLAAGDIIRGVTLAPTLVPPDGDFVYGYHALAGTAGAVAQYANQVTVGPTPANKGGVISGVMKRYRSTLGYFPFIALLNGSNITTALGYVLGLSDETSYKICLRKGNAYSLLKSTDSGVLRSSTLAYSTLQYHHLKLDVIVNPQGDVVLNVYENDLTAHNPGSPVWTAIAGMASYVDDSLGILTGSVPYQGPFYLVRGMYSAAAGSAVLLDYMRVASQVNP